MFHCGCGVGVYVQFLSGYKGIHTVYAIPEKRVKPNRRGLVPLAEIWIGMRGKMGEAGTQNTLVLYKP